METEKFKTWLIYEKSLKSRSARDVISRYKRACHLLNEEEIMECSLGDLNINTEFMSYSICVKSQLKRAVKLYSEFCKKKEIINA